MLIKLKKTTSCIFFISTFFYSLSYTSPQNSRNIYVLDYQLVIDSPSLKINRINHVLSFPIRSENAINYRTSNTNVTYYNDNKKNHLKIKHKSYSIHLFPINRELLDVKLKLHYNPEDKRFNVNQHLSYDMNLKIKSSKLTYSKNIHRDNIKLNIMDQYKTDSMLQLNSEKFLFNRQFGTFSLAYGFTRYYSLVDHQKRDTTITTSTPLYGNIYMLTNNNQTVKLKFKTNRGNLHMGLNYEPQNNSLNWKSRIKTSIFSVERLFSKNNNRKIHFSYLLYSLKNNQLKLSGDPTFGMNLFNKAQYDSKKLQWRQWMIHAYTPFLLKTTVKLAYLDGKGNGFATERLQELLFSPIKSQTTIEQHIGIFGLQIQKKQRLYNNFLLEVTIKQDIPIIYKNTFKTNFTNGNEEPESDSDSKTKASQEKKNTYGGLSLSLKCQRLF